LWKETGRSKMGSIYQVDYTIKKDGMFQVNAESEEEAIDRAEEKLEGEGEIVLKKDYEYILSDLK